MSAPQEADDLARYSQLIAEAAAIKLERSNLRNAMTQTKHRELSERHFRVAQELAAITGRQSERKATRRARGDDPKVAERLESVIRGIMELRDYCLEKSQDQALGVDMRGLAGRIEAGLASVIGRGLNRR